MEWECFGAEKTDRAHIDFVITARNYDNCDIVRYFVLRSISLRWVSLSDERDSTLHTEHRELGGLCFLSEEYLRSAPGEGASSRGALSKYLIGNKLGVNLMVYKRCNSLYISRTLSTTSL